MPIPASNPTTVNAVYDKWAISHIAQYGDGCVSLGETSLDEAGNPKLPTVRFVARMVLCRERQDGLYERSPHMSDSRQFDISDLYAQAASNPKWAQAMGLLTECIAEYAASQGAL